MLTMVFYIHYGNVRLTNCFCGIARTRAFHCVLHALGQYQTSGVLLWDHPDSFLANALSGYQGNTDRCLVAWGQPLYCF